MKDRGAIQEEIVGRLTQSHGEVVGGDSLRQILGFATKPGMARAIRQGRVALPTFHIPGRRGYFALVTDIAAWLVTQRFNDEALQDPAASDHCGE